MDKPVVPIVIDGPNFINRVLEMKVDKNIIAKQLTLVGLAEAIDIFLRREGIQGRFDVVEFVCSKKLFGTRASKFTQGERNVIFKRLMMEKGVHIEEVVLPGSSEKGVDNMVSTKIETFSEKFEYIALVSHDRDYVPLLKKMREKGNKVILVALNKEYPIELVNEGFLTIEISTEYACLFEYFYPSFFIQKDFTKDKFRELISNADDRKFNQLRVDRNGRVYISHKHVGAEQIHGVKFRYETFVAYNGYVGPKAASDSHYMDEEYEEIILGWGGGIEGYVDYPIKTVVKK